MAVKYRPEIDGLRAIAVIPVILFHAGFASFRGGFVGVDIFFVISGYLITTIILSELTAGTFTIAGFYERRARRILPALCFVVLTCLPAAWLWLPPDALEDFANSTASVALFSSNIYFKNHGSYFHAASELRPLLHTWSLGVEEQFYVLFPLGLMLLWRRARPFLLPLLGIALVGSLVLSHWAALHRPGAAFYLLPTRSWELLLGSLASIYLFRVPSGHPDGLTAPHPIIASALSATGLLLIVVAAMTFGPDTLIPGLPALLPTVGTVLIILYASPTTVVGRALGSKALVGVGLISYSAYLWHQPLLTFARWRSITPPGETTLLIAAALAFPLAYVSWRFVESPFRNRDRFDRRQIAVMAVASSLLLLTAGVSGVISEGFPSRFDLPPVTVASFEMRSALRGCMDGEDMPVRPDWLCRLGSARGEVSYLLIGDSHAMALMPAFDSASRALGIAGEFTAMSACPPIIDVYRRGRPRAVRECHDLNARILEYVRSRRPALVVLVGRWSAYTDGGYAGRQLRPLMSVTGGAPSRLSSRRTVADGLRRSVAAFADAGARVVIVSQIPEQKVDVPFKAYARTYRHDAAERPGILHGYSVARVRHEGLQAFNSDQFRALESSGIARILSFDDVFCDAERCLLGTVAESWYHDDHHLSGAGANRAVGRVIEVLRPVRSGP